MRGGLSLVEVLVAAAVAVALGLPLLALMGQSDHEAVVSEDYMFAEALAQRYLEEALAIPLEELDRKVPLEREIAGPNDEDRTRMKRHEPYLRNLSGPESFRGRLAVDRLEEGFFRYQVRLEWPVRPGSDARRHHVLLRLRCRSTLAATLRFAQGGATSERGRLKELP